LAIGDAKGITFDEMNDAMMSSFCQQLAMPLVLASVARARLVASTFQDPNQALRVISLIHYGTATWLDQASLHSTAKVALPTRVSLAHPRAANPTSFAGQVMLGVLQHAQESPLIVAEWYQLVVSFCHSKQHRRQMPALVVSALVAFTAATLSTFVH